MNQKINKLFLLGIITLIMVVGIGVRVYSNNGGEESLGGGMASVYTSNFTPTAGDEAQLIKTRAGVLGSVIITGAGAGTFNIYNASTTDATLRTIAATSSLPRLASFPANAAVGDYKFDAGFSYGLLVVWTGAIGTSTITYE